MKAIEISFWHSGQYYTGYFSEVCGAGGNVWHLTVNNYYWGNLNWSEAQDFVFHSQTGELKYLTEYFGRVVLAWYN